MASKITKLFLPDAALTNDCLLAHGCRLQNRRDSILKALLHNHSTIKTFNE
jgi:hypothetical protein